MGDLSPSTPQSSRNRSAGTATTTAPTRKTHNDFEFNVGGTKARVLKTLDDRAPAPFKKFFNSPLYDRLLNVCLLYMTSKFMLDWVVRAMDRARKQHLEGYNPYAVAARLRELEDECETLKMELSPVYSEIILKHSTYQKPQQDKMFFECMYDTLIIIMDEAFARMDKRSEIEAEVGALFRSKHFNMNQRKYQPSRSVDTLSVKELFTLKNDTSNRALNAKMLGSLYEKPVTLAVQVASVTNSPLISQFVSSPIVARAMIKDPEERNKLFNTIAKNDETKIDPRERLTAVFKTAAMTHGVDVRKLKDNLGSMKADKTTADAIGLMSEERSIKERRSMPRGIIAPESVGLPVDEAYNYLALLKRYVMYGPSLGIAQGAPGPASGVSGSMPQSFSMAGVALAVQNSSSSLGGSSANRVLAALPSGMSGEQHEMIGV